MAQIGGGTGTPITPITPALVFERPRFTAVQMPFETLRRQMEWHDWHAYQLLDGSGVLRDGINTPVIPLSGCDDLVLEQSWMRGTAATTGRARFREALAEAAQSLSAWLGFPVVRTWITETVPLSRVGEACRTFKLCRGYVRKIGAMKLDELATVALTHADTNDDTLLDVFTATLPAAAIPAGAAPDEIELHFHGNDLSQTTDAPYLIAPITVTKLNNGDWQITGKPQTAIKPKLYYKMHRDNVNDAGTQTNLSIDVHEPANYATTAIVRRRWTDESVGVSLVYNQCKCREICTCVQSCCVEPNANGTFPAWVQDARRGIGAVASCVDADRVTVSYEAGYVCDGCGINWDAVLARYAVTFVNSPPCACDAATREFARWVTNRAHSDGMGQGYRGATLESPFGSREGAIFAFEQVKALKLGRGVQMR